MFLHVNGLNYFVDIQGIGEPVVLLHGFTGNSSSWKEVIPYIEGAYQFISIDLLGHGKTESPTKVERYQIESVCQDIITILDMLSIKKTNLIGYSMGGRLALSLACTYPARINTLILESASPGLSEEGERLSRVEADKRLAGLIKDKGINSFVNYWESIPLFSSQKKMSLAKQQELHEQRLTNNQVGLSNSLKGMGTGVQPSYWSELGNLQNPTLLICGELDEKFCMIAENMATLLNSVEIKQIKQAGHAIHVEQPRKFGKIVSVFLQEQLNL
jgi:2-succinyl-6-hydroxy-2,4-cyclohexadiene-1-carboxylate synthase